MNTTIVIILIVALCATSAIVTLLIAKNKQQGLQNQLAQLSTEKSILETDIKNQQERYEEACTRHTQQLSDIEKRYQQQLEALHEQHREELQAAKELQKEQQEEQLKFIREQMNSASEKILTERSKQLSQTNSEQLDKILTPLQQNIRLMKEAVEKSGRETGTTMERLDATIKQSIEQSKEVGERADRLAQAITGENKTQGNFGELRLKQLLEQMELVEGEQFEEQATMKDSAGNTIYEEEDGHRMVPDVILHFPDKRDVIIDSKMSLKAFEEYCDTDDEQKKQEALQRHIASVRSHVNELSKKNYSKYIKEGHAKMDFVVMYVFSESALQLALAAAPTLWKEAYDKGVIISGSQNLYMMLRVLEMTWRQVRQVENQQKIMECANTIIDRVQLFSERLDAVRKQLDQTRDAFDKVEVLTNDTGRSILTPARQMLKMGATENPKRKKGLKEIKLIEEDTNEDD